MPDKIKGKICIVGGSPSAHLFRSMLGNQIQPQDKVQEAIPSLAKPRTRTIQGVCSLMMNGELIEAMGTVEIKADAFPDYPAEYFEGLTAERCVPTITGTIKPGGDGTRKLFKMLRAWAPPRKKRPKRLCKKLFGSK